jgi:integrase/recombinase XerD
VSVRTRQSRFRGTTPKTVRSILLRFAESIGPDLPVNLLTRRKLEKWVDNLTLAPTTTKTTISTVRAFCQWLATEDHLRADPSRSIQLPRLPRSIPRGIDHTAVARLYESAPDTRGQLIVSLMVQEGLRCKEVAGLELGDIDRADKILFIRCGKGGHQRVLPISAETWTLIFRYLAEHPASHGPLIRGYSHEGSHISTHAPVAPGTISKYVSRWMGDAGLKSFPKDGMSAHALRHTAATDMLRAGAHLRDVQAALGHASLATTQRYLPWVVGDLRSAMGGRSYLTDSGVPDAEIA